MKISPFNNLIIQRSFMSGDKLPEDMTPKELKAAVKSSKGILRALFKVKNNPENSSGVKEIADKYIEKETQKLSLLEKTLYIVGGGGGALIALWFFL